MRTLLLLMALGGCATGPTTPRLQTYGVFQPSCLFFCKAATTSADLDNGASQTVSSSSTPTVSGGQP